MWPNFELHTPVFFSLLSRLFRIWNIYAVHQSKLRRICQILLTPNAEFDGFGHNVGRNLSSDFTRNNQKMAIPFETN